jgi:hypothetical protein
MVETALRSVVRDSLRVAEAGMPGEHHFYITFRTPHPGVLLAERLRQTYPSEMTIVLQHQYSGLKVEQDWFEITLSFGGVPERLHIPFASITAFADPSVEFGLQFKVPDSGESPAAEKADGGGPPSEGAQVVALDSFRKK